MSLPHIIVTGASGFIGRHLVASLRKTHRVFCMARRSQARAGVPIDDNISWMQVDITDRRALSRAFRRIKEAGGADTIIHLAAFYDFTGDDDPEYWRTNVDGLRNVLEEVVQHGVRRFIFASSVAACAFPPPGGVLDEMSPPDGEHVYAATKRKGEEMLAEYDGLLESRIVRFAALFSDWCEYPPLYVFLQTWLSDVWNARVLGGKGLSAVPYLHVREAVAFMRRVLVRFDELDQREVLQVSPNGATSHHELFDLANLAFRGERCKPILMPHALARIGVWSRDLVGRLLGNRPFERPWMVSYIDLSLTVDARRTHRRLEWRPRDRLLVERRMPFLVENMKSDPVEWQRRNQAAMKAVHLRPCLRIHRLLERHHHRIGRELIRTQQGPVGARVFPHYQQLKGDILEWRYTVVMRQLMNAVRTRDKGIFTAFCRDVAARRYAEGFAPEELVAVLETLHQICLRRLREDPESEGLEAAIHDLVTMTIQFGSDQVFETSEELAMLAEERERLGLEPVGAGKADDDAGHVMGPTHPPLGSAKEQVRGIRAQLCHRFGLPD